MGRRTVVASDSAVLRIAILSLGATLGLSLSMLDPIVKLILLENDGLLSFILELWPLDLKFLVHIIDTWPTTSTLPTVQSGSYFYLYLQLITSYP